MQPLRYRSPRPRKWRFQSSPGQKAGCNPYGTDRPAPESGGFNPHPARRPDATPTVQIAPPPKVEVSILTRPEGRMQPLRYRSPRPRKWRFQSSPGQKAGCNWHVVDADTWTLLFQSSPSQKAGCNRLLFLDVVRRIIRFQSSPGQKAGCNSCRPSWTRPAKSFNPHPARRPDATWDEGLNIRRIAMFQSSPGQKAGCNRSQSRRQDSYPCCFNPHPARRPDATQPSPSA